MLLVLVVLMEYRDRGGIFGWPTMKCTDNFSKTVRLNYGPINLIRRYHGYAFSWAAIYTFWYILEYFYTLLTDQPFNLESQPKSLQATIPIWGWQMVIPWCVTFSGCRDRLLRYSNNFLYGDIGLFFILVSYLFSMKHGIPILMEILGEFNTLWFYSDK